MSHISMFVLLSTLMGGGTDLLDYVPSDDYWKAKGVTALTADALVKELEPPKAGGDISKLIPELGSPDAKVRDAAAAKVRAMGPAVVPQLREMAKNDVPEVAARARQLINEISAGGKATQVRRLMAIRTLGEKKAKEALPRLQELTRSDEPFVAEYARAAVAAIDGKPYERPHDPAGDDAWLMPEECRMVFHMATRAGKPVDYDAVMKAMPLQAPPDPALQGRPADVPDNGPRPPQPAEMRKKIVDEVIKVAEKAGNIRLDGVTVGLSGDIGDNSGFVAIVVHGEFDAKAVSSVVADMMAGANKGHGVNEPVAPPGDPANAPPADNPRRAQSKVVDGVEVFSPHNEFAFFFPSNKHAVMIGGPRQVEKPVGKLIAASKTGNGGLKAAEEMVKLIKSVDTKQPVWGAMQVTDAYRQAPVLAPFDTMTLVGKPVPGEAGKADAGTIQFKLDAKGQDPQKVKDAVAMVNQGVEEGKRQMKEMEKMMQQGGEMAAMAQMMKQVGEVLETVKCTADGANASLTASVKESLLGSPLMMFFGGFGMRAEVEIEDGAVQEGKAVEIAPEPVPDQPKR